MRFNLNFATRTYLNHRLINRVSYGVIAILLAVTVWDVSRVFTNMGEQSRLNTEISAIQKKLVTKTGSASETDINRQKSNIRFYNELVERKNTKWLSLLDLFENTTPDGISLSSLVPDKNQENWKLEGRARSFKSVQKYLEMLESSKIFSNVLLLSHQNISAGAKMNGVQFSISCKVAN